MKVERDREKEMEGKKRAHTSVAVTSRCRGTVGRADPGSDQEKDLTV